MTLAFPGVKSEPTDTNAIRPSQRRTPESRAQLLSLIAGALDENTNPRVPRQQHVERVQALERMGMLSAGRPFSQFQLSTGSSGIELQAIEEARAKAQDDLDAAEDGFEEFYENNGLTVGKSSRPVDCSLLLT